MIAFASLFILPLIWLVFMLWLDAALAKGYHDGALKSSQRVLLLVFALPPAVAAFCACREATTKMQRFVALLLMTGYGSLAAYALKKMADLFLA